MSEPTTAPLLSMTGIGKQFGAVTALAAVNLRLFPGEIHALVGENGAGKSTLIKVLTGIHPADTGTIRFDGQPVRFTGPQQAQRAGVSTVYQEVNLCPNLSVAENIYIGREPRRAGLVRFRTMRRAATELVARMGLDVDVTAPLGSYSLAVQQLIAIVRAVDLDARVLVLDEPTSSLDAGEAAQLFALMRRLAGDGVAILFVTHFLDQIFALCDRATVLRNGTLVGEYAVAELTHKSLVARMLGSAAGTLDEIEQESTQHDGPRARTADPVPLLTATGVSGRRNSVAPFDLTVHAGEVVGLAGLLGSGRTEAVRLLFGADRAVTGEVTMAGAGGPLRSPRAAVAHGLAFCPEDRKTQGLILELSVAENILLAAQAARGWARPIPARKRDEWVSKYIAALRITPDDPTLPVKSLSGGNQQKVLLARWLVTQPRLLILDEPTRGIDIGAKTEIQRLVLSLSEEGMAVVFISAELEEVLRLSHKVEVLRDRRLVAELTNDAALTMDRLMETIASGAVS
ncbi:ATP-binding cassette domain-containing protein [Nocardia sp. ET3-3]|uniref:ATP-binding cassette domain-containing protein n=1 Tax=Nocardia terrae TaxID=2675851 RepID=A0A7K1V6X6_9NOCA|nr:sugar ABC transporter ATP-binding protein [Nocardia terrae]MVU82395.1 ATP-binding cassette domain-containing protein [Nocardia terrae]